MFNASSFNRNKSNVLPVGSSDICSVALPGFYSTSCSKIDCTGSTTGSTYVITTATTVTLDFNFTGDTAVLSGDSFTFKFGVFKYNPYSDTFVEPPVYLSSGYTNSTFTATTSLSVNVPVPKLGLDGEYIVKPFYEVDYCTTFFSMMDMRFDTYSEISGNEYGIYDDATDGYFMVMKGADQPLFLNSGTNAPPVGSLWQQVVIPQKGQTVFEISALYSGNFIVTLNGLVLSPQYDYTFTGTTVTLSGATDVDDTVSFIYTTNGAASLVYDVFEIGSTVVSGSTGSVSQGVYYNTDLSAYEAVMSQQPLRPSDVIMTLNGITLSVGVDYYLTGETSGRAVFYGSLSEGDIVTIYYLPRADVFGGLVSREKQIGWMINTPPQNDLGVFTVEVSPTYGFETISWSNSQNYVVGKTLYYDTVYFGGDIGDVLYYRVKNTKTNGTLCGGEISDVAYSEKVKVTVQTL